MPQPAPTPTADEIELVAEITMLSTSTVTTMISAPSTQASADAKWSRTLADISKWPDIRDEEGDLKKVGSIEFFAGTGITTRLGFRNMVRTRYGQPLLINEYGSLATSILSASAAVPVGADW